MNYRDKDKDEQKTFYRSDRMFRADDDWYFTTREGFNIGPYPNQQSCASGLERFLRCVTSDNSIENDIEYATKIAKQSLWDTTLLQ